MPLHLHYALKADTYTPAEGLVQELDDDNLQNCHLSAMLAGIGG